jgi:hypothetical protein
LTFCKPFSINECDGVTGALHKKPHFDPIFCANGIFAQKAVFCYSNVAG